jgi:uncharacterized protein YhaN
MQLREIYIDGFGIFANKQITGLAPGINIIYGKNEFGKTTLLEFIRRILFGFPTKRDNANLYVPMQGGTLGGSLKVVLQNGEEMVISRSPGPHGGAVKICTFGETLEGQPALNHVLGNASKDIYKNIYAFTIDELHDFNTFNSDEVKNRIYGAGLGLGNISLKEIEAEIETCCAKIFRPRSSSQMGDLLEKIKTKEQDILSIQKNLTLYDELQEKLSRMLDQKIRVQNTLEDLESSKRTLETQTRLYEDTIQFLEAQNKLATLEDLSQFPENGLKTFESINQEKQNLLLRIEEEELALETLKNNRDALNVNHDLLLQEESIHRLRQSTQSVLSALQDMDRVQFEREDLEMQIAEEIKSIDRDWDEETVLTFDLTEAEKGQIDSFYDSFESLRREGDLRQDRLNSHRKMKAEKTEEELNFPKWFKLFCYGLTATGVLGMILGAYFINIPVLAIALFLIVVGIFLFKVSTKAENAIDKEDLTEKNLEQQCDNTQSDLNYKFDEWRQWLKVRNLDPTIAPIATKNIAKTVQQIKTMLTQRTRLDERISQMETLCKETRESVNSLEPFLRNVSLKNDLTLNMDIIGHSFDESKANREKNVLLENQYNNQADKIQQLENKLRKNSAELDQFLSSSGAQDSVDFLRKQSILDVKKSLQEQITQKRGIIQSNVGLGSYFDEFIEAIQTAPLEEIKQKLTHLHSKLEEEHCNREQLLQAIGETRNEIDNLSSNNDLITMQTELEFMKLQLQTFAREWAAYRAALVLFDAAKHEYEKTRQPGVIRSAENLFTQITGYERIIIPVDQDEVLIENNLQQRKGVLEMSRGTREQLYLSMRFGLISEYETRSEPLPAVMDDIFVNFDDERDKRIIKILDQFGKQRQLIVLTCHQRSIEAYKDIGATTINV